MKQFEIIYNTGVNVSSKIITATTLKQAEYKWDRWYRDGEILSINELPKKEEVKLQEKTTQKVDFADYSDFVVDEEEIDYSLDEEINQIMKGENR